MGAAAVVTEAWLDATLPPLDSLLAWLPGDMVAATARTLRAGVRVGAAIGVGLAVLALAATALRLHEFTSVRARIMARLRRTKEK